MSAAAILDRYVEHGAEPGGFFRKLLENDLVGAALAADHENKDLLYQYALHIFYRLPEECCGSRKAVEKWMRKGGRNGKQGR